MMVSKQTRYQDQTDAIRAGFALALEKVIPTLGATAPNPSVGCVLLDRAGAVVSVGVHEAAGQPHAEVMALNKAREAGTLDRAYAALVTLEPCAHHGRTPPCSEKLRHSPVQQVWIGARDPNPVAAGGGAALMQGDHAKQVIFLEEDPAFTESAQRCRALLAPFACRVTRGRPWLTVKQALTRSNSMIPPAGATTFTSASSLAFAHQVRRASDAIVTGIGTVLADNPSFTVRHVADHHGRSPRLLVVMDRHDRVPTAWREARERDGFQVCTCASLEAMVTALKEHGANWALVEAGPTTLQVLHENDMWDDWLTIKKREAGHEDQRTWRLRDGSDALNSPLALLGEGEK